MQRNHVARNILCVLLEVQNGTRLGPPKYCSEMTPPPAEAPISALPHLSREGEGRERKRVCPSAL